jgi:hypothetical protein
MKSSLMKHCNHGASLGHVHDGARSLEMAMEKALAIYARGEGGVGVGVGVGIWMQYGYWLLRSLCTLDCNPYWPDHKIPTFLTFKPGRVFLARACPCIV